MVANRLHFSKAAPAVYIGQQEGCGPIKSFAVFNLTADIPGHPAGSTVSADTLARAGYAVPPCSEITPEQTAAAPILGRVVEVVADPRGGWTHAVPYGSGSKRIYRGNWRTRGAAKAAIFQ